MDELVLGMWTSSFIDWFVITACMIPLTYRLAVAFHCYLRVPHAIPMSIAIQLIVLMALFAVA